MIRIVSIIILSLACLCANGQNAKAYDLYLEHNVVDPSNNRAMLKVHFKLKCSGVLGHNLIPVMFVDRQKGESHYWANGGQMKQDGSTYTSNYENTFWEGDQWIGIYNDRLNPLPGKRTYWVRVLIWDCNLNRFIGDLNDTEWVSFYNTGAQPAPQNNNGGAIYIPPVNNPSPCGVCGGTGRCSNCGGSGISPNHAPGIRANCGACGGTGICATCRGRGSH